MVYTTTGDKVRPFFCERIMNWADLWAALALVLILEGLIPFVSPRGYKNMVEQMAAMPEKMIRNVGLVLIFCGLVALLTVRG